MRFEELIAEEYYSSLFFPKIYIDRIKALEGLKNGSVGINTQEARDILVSFSF